MDESPVDFPTSAENQVDLAAERRRQSLQRPVGRVRLSVFKCGDLALIEAALLSELLLGPSSLSPRFREPARQPKPLAEVPQLTDRLRPFGFRLLLELLEERAELRGYRPTSSEAYGI
jgi:hypothetical protein